MKNKTCKYNGDVYCFNCKNEEPYCNYRKERASKCPLFEEEKENK